MRDRNSLFKIRVSASAQKRAEVIFFAVMLCVFVLNGCIQRKKTTTSLPRAFLEKDPSSTCGTLLSEKESQQFAQGLPADAPLGIVSTNDLHGHVEEQEVLLKTDEGRQQRMKVGGMERLASYLTALCRHYKGRLLFLDAGDSYQGTLLSNMTEGKAVLSAFSALGLKASTFGNHEFDFGQGQIKAWLASRERSFWYVTSSLKWQAEGRAIPWQELNAPRFARSVVFDVAGVKVGIAGYTTESASVKSIPTNVQGLEFSSLSSVLKSEGQPLREQGAQVNVLLSHAGGKCDMTQPAVEGDRACPPSDADELGVALRKVPNAKQDWDLVVAGHMHSAQRHVISGVPVVQSTGLGMSLAHAKVEFIAGRPRVTPLDPIYLCANHFQNWNGCHPDEWSWRTNKISQLGDLIPARVFSQPVSDSDSRRMSLVLAPYKRELAEQLSKPVAKFSVDLSNDRTGQSPAAACLADAWLQGLRESNETWGAINASKIDGVALNAGALRSGIPAGDLTFGKLFEIIPYDNTAHVVPLTESEMLAFARAHEASPHDYLLLSQGFALQREANSAPQPRTTGIRFPPSGSSTGMPRLWTLAVTSFSRTFLEKAGIKLQPVDTGLSVRESISSALKKNGANIPSCRSPELSRMLIKNP
ncbi:MAG: hypothetical protein RIR26_2673 [Pseudomonadota bacterium]